VALNWLAAYTQTGIYGVNLVCAAIFMIGLISFSRRQPLPWLALAVSVPFFLIVISMGTTRQATALGFVFGGLVAFEKNQNWRDT